MKTNQNQMQDDEGAGMDGGNSALRELLLNELADIYNAEQQLTKALPAMAQAADAETLREAFESHLEETQEQISRLERVAEVLGEPLPQNKCEAMEGLVKEGKELIDELEGSPAMDAGLIAAAQKVEHYEIATYGSLVAWAQRLGLDAAADLLAETLGEEKSADETLTGIAENLANEEATQRNE
jgi:ferritin-like metal-binding protein YciE